MPTVCMRMMFCVVGLPGSGKSTVADYIAKRYCGTVIHSGDVIRAEVRRRKLPYTPESDLKVAQWFHEKGRQKILAKRVWDVLKQSKKSILVEEGFRSLEATHELERLASQHCIIIATVCPFKIRAARLAKRKRFSTGESLSYLKERDRDELRRGVGAVMKAADYRISNNGMQKQTEKRIDVLMKRLLARRE
jgi:dephospho-CoA kinase